MPDITYCSAELKEHALDRYYTTLFVPNQHRAAMTALYAFDLELSQVREKTNEVLLGKIRLKWWYDGLEGIYNGTPAANPVAQALGKTVREYSLPRETLESLIEAYSDQLDNITPASQNKMEASAAQMGAPLYLLGLQALRVEPKIAETLAYHLGIATELTNVLINLPVDARANRCFISKDIFQKHGSSAEYLFEYSQHNKQESFPESLSAVVDDVSRMAQEHLKQARLHVSVVKRNHSSDFFSILLPASLAAHDIWGLKKSGFNPFDEQIQSTNFRKLLRLMWAAFRKHF